MSASRVSPMSCPTGVASVWPQCPKERIQHKPLTIPAAPTLCPAALDPPPRSGGRPLGTLRPCRPAPPPLTWHCGRATAAWWCC